MSECGEMMDILMSNRPYPSEMCETLKAAIKVRRDTLEAFLRAVAGVAEAK